MSHHGEYTTLNGDIISLKSLDAEETNLLKELRAFLKKTRDWNAYYNFKTKKPANSTISAALPDPCRLSLHYFVLLRI